VSAKQVKKQAIATPSPRQRGVSVRAVPAASVLPPPDAGNSAALELLFGSAFALLLLGVALTLAPRAVLPVRFSELVEFHRETVLTLLCAVALGVATGLFMVALS
jgi:hypothetical protein